MHLVFYILAAVSIITTVLPLVRKDHWTFRAFEFPRMQKLVFHGLVIILGLIVSNYQPEQLIALGLVGACAAFASIQIFPFTRLAAKSLPSAERQNKYFTLLICNVLQHNKKKEALRHLIADQDPDLILLVETDERWRQELTNITDAYPYKIEQPQNDTYGMLLYSRFRLEKGEVRFLVNDSYPSFKCLVHLNAKQRFWFYGMHPPPPSPTERAYSTPRDTELMILAEEIGKNKDQVSLVAGDLNDVAWSYTTAKFLEISGLRDPRKGRGVYSTFHARYFFMRWPLDHVFCSKQFRLRKLKKLPSIGSDHFPVLVKLHLAE